MADIIEYRWNLGPPQPIPQLQIQLPQQQPIPPPDLSVNAFPSGIRPVILRIHAQTQAPIGMIAVCVLGVMALACQDLFDVAPRKDLRFCISLFVMVLASSGERKTAIDKIVFQAVRDFERNLDAQYEEEIKAYNDANYLWKIESQVREKAYAKALSKNQDVEASGKALTECREHQPKRPVRKRFIINDASKAALKLELAKWCRSVVLVSDEAGSIMNGELFNDSPLLNSFWNGQPIEIDRANSERLRIEDERVGIMLQLQPELLTDYLNKQGKLARASGLLARMLICKAISTIGQRFGTPSGQLTLDDHVLPMFHQRVTELLNMTIKRRESKQERVCLTFSPEAAKRWENEKNRIELAIGPNGYLRDFRDYASKHPEHVARISGVLEGFETGGPFISDSTMKSAIEIANYFLNSFISLNTDNSLAEEVADAHILEKWLYDKHGEFNFCDIPRNYVRRNAPNQLRNTERLSRLYEHLQNKGVIAIYKFNRKYFIRLFPRSYVNTAI